MSTKFTSTVACAFAAIVGVFYTSHPAEAANIKINTTFELPNSATPFSIVSRIVRLDDGPVIIDSGDSVSDGKTNNCLIYIVVGRICPLMSDWRRWQKFLLVIPIASWGDRHLKRIYHWCRPFFPPSPRYQNHA